MSESEPLVVDDYFTTLFDLYLTKHEPKLPSYAYNVFTKCIHNKGKGLSSDFPVHRTRKKKQRYKKLQTQ